MSRQLARPRAGFFGLLSALPLVVSAWACSGGSGAREETTGASDSGAEDTNGTDSVTSMGGGSSDGSSTDSGSTTTTAGGGSGGSDGGVKFDLNCEEAAMGAPVLRMLTRQEFGSTIDAVFPEVSGQWQNSLPANLVSMAGFDNAASNEVGEQMAEKLLESAEAVATVVSGSALGTILPCASSTADSSCALEFLAKYGQRLFRRPLTESERERYLEFFDSATSTADFPTAIHWITVGLIQSPFAVYRSEIGTDLGNGTRQLDAFELATELAYTYTGAPPSDDLLASAGRNDLGDLSVLAEQLLGTPAGAQALQRFFEGYAQYTRISSTQKPNVEDFETAKLDMIAETRAFIDQIVFQQGGGVRELLTSPTTNLSTKLAQYYGFDAPASDFAAVARPAGRGVGLLAQGSFLATHANANASSPTQRGVFTFMNLLCQPKPDLPDDVPDLAPANPGVITTRQRYEETHAASAVCAGCHKKFDPIGFAFEHFDEGGRYRDQEVGLPIDATGTVIDNNDTELFTFDGQEQLMNNLADQSIVYQCFSAYLATYAFGTAESCLGQTRAADLEAGTLGIAQAFAALTVEPHFTTRTAE